jgi:molecular chaperone GrpE
MKKNSKEESEVEMIEKDKYVRLFSDFENFKKRTNKEREDYLKTANSKLILDIIPTVDDFERAEIEDDGIKIIYNNLKRMLEKYGVKEVETKGLDFNSDFMEALTQINAGEDMKGKVVDVIEKAYEMNGKIIRFAKVAVGS